MASRTAMDKAHVFPASYVKNFFKNKYIVFIGDSVVRCMYKDFVCQLENANNGTNRLLNNDKSEMKAKAEDHFLGDRLTFRTGKGNGTGFFESREYHSSDGYHVIQYYFITRCYYDRVEQIIHQWETDPQQIPDVLFMNSMLWDISRYQDSGDHFFPEYRVQLNKLCSRLRDALPYTSLVVWLTTLPVASKIASNGFLQTDIHHMEDEIRVAVVAANRVATQVLAMNGFDVLDLHYYIRPMIKHRELDGTHWDAFVHRHITDLLISYLHDTWQIRLPRFATEHIKQFEETSLHLKHLKNREKPSFQKPMVQFLGDLANEYMEFVNKVKLLPRDWLQCMDVDDITEWESAPVSPPDTTSISDTAEGSSCSGVSPGVPDFA